MQDVTNPVSLPSIVLCRMFLFLPDSKKHVFTHHTIGPNDLHPSQAQNFRTFKVFLIYFLKFSSSSTIQSCAPNVSLY
jgi:hypothetical protein